MLLEIVLTIVFLYIGIKCYPKQTFRFLSIFAGPFIRLYIKKRISDKLEDKDRQNERFGIPSKNRPYGKLVWIHAVSVGETISVIPFIEEFKKINPDTTILLTTTTLTAAKLVEDRLKDSVIHQFMPFDVYKWDRRFVKYWKPDAVFFVESEIWPNILYYLYEKDIPTYMLNVRVSERSLKRLFFAKKFFNILPYSLFRTVFVPTDEIKKNVRDLGAREIEVVPNLKTISKKLPVNFENSENLKNKINGRKVWIAVSSHKGEEEIILDVHKKLKEKYPDILTVIAIRHPARTEGVGELCSDQNFSVSLYSKILDDEKKISEDILILDKIGCLGEFFETIDTVLVCGSLIDGIGGHNMLEPLNFMCNVATGQYIENFRDIYQYVEKYCKKLTNANEITEFITESIELYKRNPEILKDIDFTKHWIKAIKQISKSVYNRGRH